MDIKSYLLELIATQKSIGIHALGTLYKKKIPGRYDSETHSFLPPKHEVVFETAVNENQHLVNFISEKRNISIESASDCIAEFVADIQMQLTDHQQADLSPIGQLKLINDQIVLEVSDTLEIGLNFYGLPIVAAIVEKNPIVNQETELNSTEQVPEEPVDNEITEEKIPPNLEHDDQPVYNEISEVNAIQELNENEERVDIESASEEPDEVSTKGNSILDPLWQPSVINRYEYDEEEEENSGKGMRIFLKTLLVLFVIAIAGVVSFLFFPDLFNGIRNNFSDEGPATTPTTEIDHIAYRKVDSSTADSVKKPMLVASVSEDSLDRITYEVIGSAMKTQRKVNEVIRTLSKRGIKAKKMEAMPGKLIKISLGTFTDLKLAKKFQDSLKIKLRNPEIYIQTIKPKN